MHYKNIHVIYYSPTHTSARIAHAIVEGMKAQVYHETDITCKMPEKEEVIEDELVIVAAPVYGGRLPKIAIDRLKMFKGTGCPVIPVVLYGNRDYEDALLELCDLMKEQGFLPIAAGAFIGEHSFSRPGFPIAEGRPDDKDHEIAMKFGEKALSKLHDIETVEDIEPLEVRGNRPYKELRPSTPQAPVTNQSVCIKCGHCIKVCPTGAMSLHGMMIYSDADKCTKCCACVKECPVEALTFDTPYTKMLFENFSARREPEVFI